MPVLKGKPEHPHSALYILTGWAIFSLRSCITIWNWFFFFSKVLANSIFFVTEITILIFWWIVSYHKQYTFKTYIFETCCFEPIYISTYIHIQMYIHTRIDLNSFFGLCSQKKKKTTCWNAWPTSSFCSKKKSAGDVSLFSGINVKSGLIYSVLENLILTQGCF